jgi:hypothetical protein
VILFRVHRLMNLLRRSGLVLFLCAALGVIGACSHRGDPRQATKEFFDLLASGKTQEAYEASAFAFRAQQSLKAFEITVKEQGLAGFATAVWESPVLEGRSAKMRGEVMAPTGEKGALVVTLTDEDGRWRVFAIRTPRSRETGLAANLFGSVGRTTAFIEAIDRPIPEEKTVRALTTETLLFFNDAVQARSFEEFYNKVSKTWQKQLTIGQLNRAFQPFIDNGVSLAGIKDIEPVFDGPAHVSSEGLLVISGMYPTAPYRVIFSLRFIYELPTWKLFGIDVTLRK